VIASEQKAGGEPHERETIGSRMVDQCLAKMSANTVSQKFLGDEKAFHLANIRLC